VHTVVGLLTLITVHFGEDWPVPATVHRRSALPDRMRKIPSFPEIPLNRPIVAGDV
jgi:hypothetical protein